MASTKTPTKSVEPPATAAPPRRTTIEDVIGGLLHWNDPWFGRDGHIEVEEADAGGVHVIRAELPGVDPEADIDVMRWLGSGAAGIGTPDARLSGGPLGRR